MALTKSNTNYNGILASTFIKKVFGVGNELFDKNIANLITNIDSKGALPRLSSTDDPLKVWEDTPSGVTVTTTYNERTLTVVKSMLYETFNPEDFHTIWKEFQSQGNMSDLRLNPKLYSDILDIYINKAWTQISKVFWQGDTASGTAALKIFDGMIKLMLADANVIDVANIGVITTSNVNQVLQDVWEAIPDRFIDDPDMRILMSTTDWRKAQTAHQNAKLNQVGFLDSVVSNLYLSNRIDHLSGIPENTVVAARGMTTEASNLHLGVWVNPNSENPRVDRVAANSEQWFTRTNYKIGCQYRDGSELVLYRGA
jgi:hypothetical protein